MKLILFLGIGIGLLATSSLQAQVRRFEVIAMAEAYRVVKWTPTSANVFHGIDADGIRVDTPDASFSSPGISPGWWIAGKVNQGMPYMWGGFSVPVELQAALLEGRYAGDVANSDKRRLGDAAVSKYAVGIDCSGLVSRCWKLDRSYSTSELPSICVALASVNELMAGDILNSPNNHVLIFKAFADTRKERILAYEAGSPPTWKVLLNSVPLSFLAARGYTPLRYRHIFD